jgi:hypothetical protein
VNVCDGAPWVEPGGAAVDAPVCERCTHAKWREAQVGGETR